MVQKGNLEYMTHYAAYFDGVTVAYIAGSAKRELSHSVVRYLALGSIKGTKLDVILAPLRLLKLARRLRVTDVLSADLVYSWWTLSLLRIIGRYRSVIMPVCIPEQIYRDSGTSLSGRSISLERRLVKLSLRTADIILTSANLPAYVDWLNSDPHTRSRLRIVPVLPEEFPPPAYYQPDRPSLHYRRGPLISPRLLYVGRLHPEKHVSDLPEIMARLVAWGLQPTLVIVGDGPARTLLEQLADEAGVSQHIELRGWQTPAQLIHEYQSADIFLSPLTGTALREAGLLGLPVVAYDIDWVHEVLEHRRTAMLVPRRDISAFASAVYELAGSEALRVQLAESLRAFAAQRWSPSLLAHALHEAFA